MKRIQYTVRGVPPPLDQELRREARATGKTLNTVVLQTLAQAKLPVDVIHGDLDWFVGAAARGDRDFDAAQTWLDSLPTDSR